MHKDGEAVRGIRKALGLSQARFGHYLGVDSGTISRWERDMHQPQREAHILLTMISKQLKAGFTCEEVTAVLRICDGHIAKAVVELKKLSS